MAGGYCTGKNAVVAALVARGFRQIEVDAFGHLVLTESAVRREVVDAFGARILGADGEIDRKVLGAIVFRDRRLLGRLEAVVHPRMIARVEDRLRADSGPTVINAAILFRMRLERLCDFVICVRAPLLKRLARARRRDGLSLYQALRRVAAQRGICSKTNGEAVDIYYVDNSRGLDWLETQAAGILGQRETEVR